MERFKSINDLLTKIPNCPWCNSDLLIKPYYHTMHDVIQSKDKLEIKSTYTNNLSHTIIVDTSNNNLYYKSINNAPDTIELDLIHNRYIDVRSSCIYRVSFGLNMNHNMMKVSSIDLHEERLSFCDNSNSIYYIRYKGKLGSLSVSNHGGTVNSKILFSGPIPNRMYLDCKKIKEKINNILLLA